MPDHTYTPTSGMMRALVDARGADALDYVRCRLRGLLDLNHMPTRAGRAVIARQMQRLRDLGHA